MLPQVLVGLGLFSLVSAGCLFWLERFQPLFLAVSVGSLAYEGWIVHARPPIRRTWGIKSIFVVSLVLNVLLVGSWIVLWFRYR
jgi:hypothetical protein